MKELKHERTKQSSTNKQLFFNHFLTMLTLGGLRLGQELTLLN